RSVIGTVLAVLGAAGIAGGLLTDQSIGAWFIAGGAFALLFAVTALSPVLGKPLLHGLGSAYRAVFGTVGQLATQNTLRNPRRSAATASALMIGLALVSAIAVLGASVKKSVDVGGRKAVKSDVRAVLRECGRANPPARRRRPRRPDAMDARHRRRR